MPVPPGRHRPRRRHTDPRALRPLLDTVLEALATAPATARGPCPPAAPTPSPRTTRRRQTRAPRPRHRTPRSPAHPHPRPHPGAADPADPHCAAHLHCPPLALAVAADLAASALNPSMDSWDQAPAATKLRPSPPAPSPPRSTPTPPTPTPSSPPAAPNPTNSPCSSPANATPRTADPAAPPSSAAPTPTTASPAPPGSSASPTRHRPHPHRHPRPRRRPHHPRQPPRRPALLVAATAGTTDTGIIDPLPALADLADHHGAALHIDAAYGGPLLFSTPPSRPLAGLARAHTVSLDLHKLGWQPVAAGLLAVPDPTSLAPLAHSAAYLNADDDTEAGLPDLLGRSLRTTRRPDILKTAVTLKALGRHGLGRTRRPHLAAAQHLADLIDPHPRYDLHHRPTLSTVLFRPTGADDTASPPSAAPSSPTAPPSSAAPHAAAASGSRPRSSTPTPTRTTSTTLLNLVEGHIPR